MDKFKLTPKSSNVESLMERFRLEFGNAVEEDKSNNRRISISPVKFDSNQACNIDSQIKELEDIIAKLENEISDMSKSAGSEYISNVDSESKKSYVIEENNEKAEFIDDELETGENGEISANKEYTQYSHVFPLLIQDIILPAIPENKPLITVVSELLSVREDDSSDQEQINAVKQEVLNLWSDLQFKVPKDNINILLEDLQNEISDALKTVKIEDIEIDSPVNEE